MAEEPNLDHFDLGTFVDYVHALKQERDALRAQPHSQVGEAVAAPTPAPTVDSSKPELTVWVGPMPESNGKSNFTAVLMRKGADLFDGLTGGITIERSEYPDRVQYEADRMRYLIGELDAEPDILAYDPDKHSGYTHPAVQVAEGVVVSRELLDSLLTVINSNGYAADEVEVVDELRALLAKREGG